MLRRLRRHPVKFVLGLPVALAEKPRRLIDEVRPLIMNDEQSGQHGRKAESSSGA